MRHLLCVIILLSSSIVSSGAIDDFIYKAEVFRNDQDLGRAVSTMREAVKTYPQEAAGYSYLGYYLGMQLGYNDCNNKAEKISDSSFHMLSKAVTMDRDFAIARYHRGATLVRYANHTEKQHQGITDLEVFLKLYKTEKENISYEYLLDAYCLLAEAYLKNNDQQKAILTWEKIIAMSPDSPQSLRAESILRNIHSNHPYVTVAKNGFSVSDISYLEQKLLLNPNDVDALIDLGISMLHCKRFSETETICEKVFCRDPSNIWALKLWVVSSLREDSSNTPGMLAKMLTRLDAAIQNTPSDKELHLIRGMLIAKTVDSGTRLRQAFDDLNYVMDSLAPECLKGQALYWLQVTHQKLLLTKDDLI